MTEFTCPVRIISGKNALESLRSFSSQRAMIVTDSYFSSTKKAQQIGNLLPNAEIQIFDEVQPDPSASLTAKGAAACKAFRPDLLIALGGGSPMDCAKAIRMAAELPMTFVAIPTTSGSGSEVTSFSIITHGAVKHALVDPILRPDVAILDDSLLQALPKKLIADTGMDLLTHCLEAVAAANRNGFTDALAVHGAKTVFSCLTASFNGDDTVRIRLHEAATMAGLAFDQAGLGVCHAIAHVLGGELHIPHGRLCAMLLPPVLEANIPAAMRQYAAVAASCGFAGATDKLSARNLIRAIEQLRSQLSLPASLKHLGTPWKPQQSHCLAVLEDPCCKTNPVPVTEALVMKILRAVCA